MDKPQFFNKMIADAASTKQRLFLSAVNLFSSKGYANVGIRELCRSVNIKESAFYNHYRSKEDLFDAILGHFIEISGKAGFSDDEINEITRTGNIGLFLKKSMKLYIDAISDPLYSTLLQIVLMESYTNAAAYKLVKADAYSENTEQLIRQMMDKGLIRKIDASTVTAAFYYGLKGIMQEYLINKAWGGNDDITEKINSHADLFVEILTKQEGLQ